LGDSLINYKPSLYGKGQQPISSIDKRLYQVSQLFLIWLSGLY